MMQKRTLYWSSNNRSHMTTQTWSSAPSGCWTAKTRRVIAQRARQVPLVRATTAPPAETTGAAAVKSGIWEGFASQASGEWEGITATFSPSGAPQQLPEYYVPEAFREWHVELHDWQSQCSSCASITPDGRYEYSSMLRRLMPTVGCEADAIAFTEEHSGGDSSNSGGSSSGSSSICEVMAVRADGSYNTGPAGWPSAKDASVTSLQIEHCLMVPELLLQQQQQSEQQQQQRHRVKVVQKFERKDGNWEFTAVELHREKYDSPYTGRRDLAGCGGGQSAIAQLPPLKSLGGGWRPAEGHEGSEEVLVIGGSKGSSNYLQLVGRSTSRSSCLQRLDDYHVMQGHNLSHVTKLPLNAWSRVVTTKTGHLLKAEAGVLFDSSRQIVSERTYVAAQKVPWELKDGLAAAMIDEAGLLDANLMVQERAA